METQCNEVLFDFQGQNRRDVVATFDGGTITTDGGALLLREVERHTGIISGFSACFADHTIAATMRANQLRLFFHRIA